VKQGIPKPDISEEEQVALHNVTSSLYNRSQVREVLDAAISDVCRALGIPVPEKKRKGKKDKDDGKDAPTGREEDGEQPADRHKSARDINGTDGKEAVKVKDMPKDQEREDGVWSGEEEEDAQNDDDEEDEDEFKGFSDEVESEEGEASGASSDDESVDSTDDAEERAVYRLEAQLGSSSESEQSGEDCNGESDDESVGEYHSGVAFSVPGPGYYSDSEDEVPQSPPPKAKKKKATTKLTTDSTFLPTLMGGYISGSESASDIDIAPPTKKNRRGQRARQAIWEKKFGEKAKHLKKDERDVGWDPRRGAVDTDGKPWKKGIRNPLEKKSRQDGEQRPAETRPKPKPQDTGPLHPSWEARKKAKEMQETATFQGKKVVFD